MINLTYILFTDEQKQRAASVNLEAFLRSRGERLISSGRDKRLASDHSVTIRGNEWYDHAVEKGGTAISFVQRHYGVGYAEAVSTLLGDESGVAYSQRSGNLAEPKPFALPPANKNMHRVFAYLCKTRCINRDVVSAFAKAHLIYEYMRMQSTTMRYSSGWIQMVLHAMLTSAARTARANHSARTLRAVTRSTVSITQVQMGVSMHLRLP